ncbi:MAG: hypothetical protein WA830_24305 [Candidatus Sulfotelmatobacter sp.]
MGSTPTRFRHLKPASLLKIVAADRLGVADFQVSIAITVYQQINLQLDWLTAHLAVAILPWIGIPLHFERYLLVAKSMAVAWVGVRSTPHLLLMTLVLFPFVDFSTDCINVL